MDLNQKGKPSDSTPKLSLSNLIEDLSDYESHGVTLTQSNSETEWLNESNLHSSIEYHLTVEIPNSSLTRRDLSLILDVLNYQAVNYGVTFTMQLCLYELYFRILGNKTNSSEVSEEYVRKTLTVTEIILKLIKDKSLVLSSESKLYFKGKAKELLRIGLMDKRTYSSRFRTWRPEKFLRIRTVPVDIQFLTRRKDSSRYSGYCKGYGESHGNAHKSNLRPSAEYDGDTRSESELKDLKVFELCTNPVHQLSNILLIRFKNYTEEENV